MLVNGFWWFGGGGVVWKPPFTFYHVNIKALHCIMLLYDKHISFKCSK